jgi:FAD:protein FMN transferase
MATRFELVLEGDDPGWLRAAGEEAVAEIQRIEARLSFYRPTSEIGRLNREAADGPVCVDAEVFALLVRAAEMSRSSGGAFDVTVGPLMRCWRFAGGTGALPEPGSLAEARGRVGMQLLELDSQARTVRFARPGVLVDLGAIGKGYALEQAAALLREAGVRSALLHGGTSTVCAIGRPVGADAWKVAIELPDASGRGGPEHALAVIGLEDRSLSVSAVWGKAFAHEGRVFGHVLDPRAGWPAEGAVLAAVVGDSATETDALSTALVVLGLGEHEVITRARPELPVLVVGRGGSDGGLAMVARGISPLGSERTERIAMLP